MNFKTGLMPLSLVTWTLLLYWPLLACFVSWVIQGADIRSVSRRVTSCACLSKSSRRHALKALTASAAPETAGNAEKTSVLKLSVFKALTFRDLTSFVVFPSFLKRNAKEITKWSEMSLSTTQSSSTSTSLLVMSQSIVWPRRGVGTVTSCCKLRLCNSFLFVLFFQVSNRNIRVRVKMRIYVANQEHLVGQLILSARP